jgi:hypothetical protein
VTQHRTRPSDVASRRLRRKPSPCRVSTSEPVAVEAIVPHVLAGVITGHVPRRPQSRHTATATRAPGGPRPCGSWRAVPASRRSRPVYWSRGDSRKVCACCHPSLGTFGFRTLDIVSGFEIRISDSCHAAGRLQLLDDKVPDVVVTGGRMIGILYQANRTGVLGEFLETEGPGRRVDLVVHLRDVRRLGQAPVVFEVDRRGVLVQQPVGRPLLDERQEFPLHGSTAIHSA